MEKTKAIFPKASVLARKLEMPFQRVNAWYVRNNVPPMYWRDVIEAAKSVGATLTLDDMEEDYQRRLAP